MVQGGSLGCVSFRSLLARRLDTAPFQFVPRVVPRLILALVLLAPCFTLPFMRLLFCPSAARASTQPVWADCAAPTLCVVAFQFRIACRSLIAVCAPFVP